MAREINIMQCPCNDPSDRSDHGAQSGRPRMTAQQADSHPPRAEHRRYAPLYKVQVHLGCRKGLRVAQGKSLIPGKQVPSLPLVGATTNPQLHRRVLGG